MDMLPIRAACEALALLAVAAVSAHDVTVEIGEFVRLGVLTVPLALVAGVVGLWLAVHVV